MIDRAEEKIENLDVNLELVEEKINLENKLTEQGIEKFCADWKNLIV